MDTEVIIAVVTTIGATIGVLGTAVLPGYISTRKKAQTIDDKIGEPNGHGSIVSMLDEILGLLRDHGKRITRVEETINDLRKKDEE